jgi:Icc-related predicted phosphoesterase
MKIIGFSDTHRSYKEVILPEGDVGCFSGDNDFRHETDVIDFCDWYVSQPLKKRIVVAGNHDFFPYHKKLLFENILKNKGIIYLQDEGIEIDGVKFWGSPWTSPFFNWAFMREEEKLKQHWQAIPTDTDVLITHSPPYGYGDLSTYKFEHIGSKSLLSEIKDRIKPKAHFFGHNHSGYGQYDIEGIKSYNVSLLNEKYEVANKPVEVII